MPTISSSLGPDFSCRRRLPSLAVVLAGLSAAWLQPIPDAQAWTASQFKKPTPTELHTQLTELQYHVTQEAGTEPPNHNEYWDNHQEGLYVDRVSGEPLFTSKEKYESGTGWPSFTHPISPEHVITKTDHELFMQRTEVRGKLSDAHLGHVFDDGPAPAGTRYCMNSASLRFIPVDRMEAENYGEYLPLFGKKAKSALAPSGLPATAVHPATPPGLPKK